jgi:hypothetical protein
LAHALFPSRALHSIKLSPPAPLGKTHGVGEALQELPRRAAR